MSELEPNSIEQPNNLIANDKLMDYGPLPAVIDIKTATIKNDNFRIALWTGSFVQITLMSVLPNQDIGVEMHKNLDQILKIEDGYGLVRMGASKDALSMSAPLTSDNIIIVPAGTWHNISNIGYKPLKLYSIYAPPSHPASTLQKTKPVTPRYPERPMS